MMESWKGGVEGREGLLHTDTLQYKTSKTVRGGISFIEGEASTLCVCHYVFFSQVSYYGMWM